MLPLRNKVFFRKTEMDQLNWNIDVRNYFRKVSLRCMVALRFANHQYAIITCQSHLVIKKGLNLYLLSIIFLSRIPCWLMMDLKFLKPRHWELNVTNINVLMLNLKTINKKKNSFASLWGRQWISQPRSVNNVNAKWEVISHWAPVSSGIAEKLTSFRRLAITTWVSPFASWSLDSLNSRSRTRFRFQIRFAESDFDFDSVMEWMVTSEYHKSQNWPHVVTVRICHCSNAWHKSHCCLIEIIFFELAKFNCRNRLSNGSNESLALRGDNGDDNGPLPHRLYALALRSLHNQPLNGWVLVWMNESLLWALNELITLLSWK